jgi:hypothetical protein
VLLQDVYGFNMAPVADELAASAAKQAQVMVRKVPGTAVTTNVINGEAHCHGRTLPAVMRMLCTSPQLLGWQCSAISLWAIKLTNCTFFSDIKQILCAISFASPFYACILFITWVVPALRHVLNCVVQFTPWTWRQWCQQTRISQPLLS